MPYLAWRAIRVVLWTAFCAVAVLFLWHEERPQGWRLGGWLVLIWVGVAVFLWQIGSESPSDRDIAEAIALERSRQREIAGKVLPNDAPRPMTVRKVHHDA